MKTAASDRMAKTPDPEILASRLYRDLRNDLARHFMTGLQTGDMQPVHETAARYATLAPADFYHDYIHERLTRYEKTVQTIRDRDIQDPLAVAMLLWDNQLFFEVHEYLEPLWLRAAGLDKEILQALIRAAGVYVHLRQNNPTGARKMADRAIAVFERHRRAVPALVNLKELLPKLRRLDPDPPKLLKQQK
jgi:hypothetical protein